MEDALAPVLDEYGMPVIKDGLNPCCNGRCTRTQIKNYLKKKKQS